MEALEAFVALEASLGGGTLGLAAVCAGESMLYQADTIFPTASSIKIALVEEIFQQGLDLVQPITVTELDFVGGSGVLASLTPGVALPLGDLATLAISLSDNTASNLCLRAVGGPEAVNARLATWGCRDTRIHRPIKFKLEDGDPPHTATGTPADFLKILAQLGPETKKRLALVGDTAMLPRLLGVILMRRTCVSCRRPLQLPISPARSPVCATMSALLSKVARYSRLRSSPRAALTHAGRWRMPGALPWREPLSTSRSIS